MPTNKTGTQLNQKYEAHYISTLPDWLSTKLEKIADDRWVEILEKIGDCRVQNKAWRPIYKPPAKPEIINYGKITEEIMKGGEKNQRMSAAGIKGGATRRKQSRRKQRRI